MTTTNNRAWKALLPQNGMIGMSPQVGRVKIPPIRVRQTLNLTGGRKIKAVKACWLEKGFGQIRHTCPLDGKTPPGNGLVERRRDHRIRGTFT